jgi:regulator of replication initiation timing
MTSEPTEDDIVLVEDFRASENHIYYDLLIRSILSKQLTEQLKQQILQALQENPKLKTENEDLKQQSIYWGNLYEQENRRADKAEQENQSLKQDNRNLKFRICDEQDEHNHIKAEIHAELSRLKQLEKAVREWKETDEGKDLRLLDKAGYPKLQNLLDSTKQGDIK